MFSTKHPSFHTEIVVIPLPFNDHRAFIFSSSHRKPKVIVSQHLKNHKQMAQNQKSHNSEGICKRICGAVPLRPLRATIRRISHHPGKPQTSISTTPYPNPARGSKERVHAEKDAPKGAKPSVHFAAAKTKSLKDDVPLHQKRDGGEKIETDDRFSNYIRKIKNKMGIVSNVGAGRSATRRDSFNDKVTNYINRTKIKIRQTTSVGNHKGVSSE